jgi:hypothetical protein
VPVVSDPECHSRDVSSENLRSSAWKWCSVLNCDFEETYLHECVSGGPAGDDLAR